MLTRRELVQNAMAFSVWPSLRPFAAAALQQIQSEGAPNDETFWAYVRLEFELTPEFTNLVSVVRGNFTKANREIAFNEATRLNQLSAPLHMVRGASGAIQNPSKNLSDCGAAL